MAAIAFTLATGRYLVSTMGVQRLINCLETITDVHPKAADLAATLQAKLRDLPTDVSLQPDDRETILRALDEMLGDKSLPEELSALRSGLLRDP